MTVNKDVDTATRLISAFIEEIPPHILIKSESFGRVCQYLAHYYLPSSPPELVPELSMAFNQEIENVRETRNGVGLAWEITQRAAQFPQTPSVQEDIVKTLEGFMRLDSNFSKAFNKRSIFSYKRYTDTHKFLYEKAEREESQQEAVSRVWHNYCQVMDERNEGESAAPVSREALLRYQRDLTWVKNNTCDIDIRKGVVQALVTIEQEILTMPVISGKTYDVKRPTFSLWCEPLSFETH